MLISRHTITTLFFILFLASCNSDPMKEPGKPKQTPPDPKKQTNETPTSAEALQAKGKTISVGYPANYENLPQLVFDSVSEAEFNHLKSRKDLQKLKVEKKGTEFQVYTSSAKHTFKKYKNEGGSKGFNGYELNGYYPALKLYALTENSSSDDFGFGELFLLDSITDYRYTIVSFGDNYVENPVPSGKQKYLVYYYNYIYESGRTDIGVLKIGSKKDPDSYLKEYASYHSDQFAAEEIRWKNDRCFYVKGYTEIRDEASGEWIRKYGYYRANLP